jgi:hypothetical protein
MTLNGVVYRQTVDLSWWSDTTPTTLNPGTAVQWVGQKLQFTVPGRLFGYRMFKDTSLNGNTHGLLWDDTTFQLYAAFAFRSAGTGATGWHQTWPSKVIRVDLTVTYDLVVLITNGKYWSTPGALASPVVRNGIRFLAGIDNTNLNIAQTSPASRVDAFGVDVLFRPD